MAKTEWYKCYSPCNYLGKVAEFVPGINGKKCPKCQADDCTFPYRLFKCRGCGRVESQDFWFPEFPLDDNPVESLEQPDAIPCKGCFARWEVKFTPSGRVSSETWVQFDEESEKMREKPAELEEILPQERRNWRARGKLNFPGDPEFHRKSRTVKAEATSREDAISKLKLETVLKLGCSRDYVVFVELFNLVNSGPVKEGFGQKRPRSRQRA